MGVDLLTLKRLLNHTDRRDVTFPYERYDRAREKRAALDAWARRLHQIVTGETAPKIVPLRAS
jgi:hypothetical protein